MFKEILQKLSDVGYIVTTEYTCLVVRSRDRREEVDVISNFDKDRDSKLRKCYYRLISQ
ncbi:hypothetical protein NE686_17705 [Tissierella carlieri]|uniref:Uncharacterized protein n=1 Tax=Tissierella carlieri TaxID=689904 RepID=A0ABT1SEP7_9FIRM|nr:hypothetical protein [Tissierella carlieri]MCQ4924940.1 hypothetical protein [Tissierella carlieri]